MTKTLIPVVNASVIHKLAAGIEDRYFGCDLRLTQLDQRMLRIVQRRKLVSVVAEMLLNRRAGLRLVGIYQPEGSLTGVLRTDSLNRRSIAIGDRTIGSYEDQHRRLPGISVQRIHRFACQIDSGWRLACKNAYGADSAAGVDVGNADHHVAVPPGRDAHRHDYGHQAKDQQLDCRNALPTAVHRPPPVACSDSKQDASQSTSAHGSICNTVFG